MTFDQLTHVYDPRHEDYDDITQAERELEITELLSSAKQSAEFILAKTDEEVQQIANSGKVFKHTFDGVEYAIARALCFALQAAQSAKQLGESGQTARTAAIGVVISLLNQLPIDKLEGVFKELDQTL